MIYFYKTKSFWRRRNCEANVRDWHHLVRPWYERSPLIELVLKVFPDRFCWFCAVLNGILEPKLIEFFYFLRLFQLPALLLFHPPLQVTSPTPPSTAWRWLSCHQTPRIRSKPTKRSPKMSSTRLCCWMSSIALICRVQHSLIPPPIWMSSRASSLTVFCLLRSVVNGDWLNL